MRDTEPPANAQGEGVTVLPRRPREETARLGKEVYERDIRPQVETDHHGEVADGEIAAVACLQAMRPSAVNVLCERVGYRALRSFGAVLPSNSWRRCSSTCFVAPKRTDRRTS